MAKTKLTGLEQLSNVETKLNRAYYRSRDTENFFDTKRGHALVQRRNMLILEQRGWVLRTQCADDKRKQYAALTAAGQSTLDQVAPDHVATVRRLVFDQLSDTDVESLRRITTKIVAAIDW